MNKQLYALLIALLVGFAYGRADNIAQMTVGTNVSTTTPMSGEVFHLDILVGSKASGETGLISGVKVAFDLPPNLNIVIPPNTYDGLYTLVTTGDTHVELQFNSDIPVGFLRSFRFFLQFEQGVSVTDVNVADLTILAMADNADSASEAVLLNPQNNAPTVNLWGEAAGSPDAAHSAYFRLTPEACVGGLNHHDGQVEIKIHKDATVYSIQYKGEELVLSNLPQTPEGDYIRYLLPVDQLDVCHQPSIIEIKYAYPPTNDPAGVEYTLTATYTAVRQNGDEVNQTYLIQETVTPTIIGEIATHIFEKKAQKELARKPGQSQTYRISFNPIYAVDNVVIIDDPIELEPQFFDVNRFTKISWTGTSSQIGSPEQTQVKVACEYSNQPGTWVDVNSTPSFSGSSDSLSTDNSQYVTRFKIELFNENGGSDIAQYTRGVEIVLSATTLSEIEITSNIPDSLLKNEASASGILNGHTVTDARFSSSTTLISGSIFGYLDYSTSPSLWHARNELEAEQLSGKYPYFLWGVPGWGVPGDNITGIPVTGALKEGDEFWYMHYSDLEGLDCKDYHFTFDIQSPYFEVLDVVGGNGIGLSREDYPYEVFENENATVVKVALNGTHDLYHPKPNNPFTILDWENNQLETRQNIGVKLRVKKGATTTRIRSTAGTTNFDQPFGNGIDAFADAADSNLFTTGAFSNEPEQYWRFMNANKLVIIDNAVDLSTEKSVSLDGVNYQPTVSIAHDAPDQEVYFKLHVDNQSTGGFEYTSLKIIDALPFSGDKMVLSEAEKGSTTTLSDVSVEKTILIDAANDSTVLTAADWASNGVLVYYSDSTSIVDRLADLSAVNNLVGNWVDITSNGLVPDGATDIKVILSDTLHPDYKVDVILKATLSASGSNVEEVAWNSFGLGATYENSDTTYNIVPTEPGKSGIRRTTTDDIYSISGKVWNDTNQDGIQDAGEPRAEGVTVSLYNSDDEWRGDYVTGADGTYHFDFLAAETWQVRISQQRRISPFREGNDRTVDCDFTKYGNFAVAVVNIIDEDAENIDCGLINDIFVQTEVMCAGENDIVLDVNHRPIGIAYWFATETDANAATTVSGSSPLATGSQYAFVKNNTDAKETLYLRFANESETNWLDADAIDQVVAYLIPDTLVWNGSINHDWNDAGNWTYPVSPNPWEGTTLEDDEIYVYKMPRACTNVYIPSEATNYPSLDPDRTNYDKLFNNAECNRIHFGNLSKVARTDLLSYSEAYVDLKLPTFGWHTLAAPLQNMYSGDYAFERITPQVQMKVFNSPNPQTGASAIESDWSATFNTDTVSLHAVMGYNLRAGRGYYPLDQFKANPDEGLVSGAVPVRLDSATWHFPKNALQFKHYDQFSYARRADKDQYLPDDSYRDNRHRFTYEQAQPYDEVGENLLLAKRTVPSGYQGELVLLGNPFMSCIDFAAFYRENYPYILPQFDGIWNNNNFSFSATDSNEDGTLENILGNPYIQPMQSFIVKLREGISLPCDLKFYNKMSVLETYSTVPIRAAASNDNPTIIISAERGGYSDKAYVQIIPSTTPGYHQLEDTKTILHTALDDNMLRVFTVTDNFYLQVNRTNVLPKVLKIGIKTGGSGTTNLQLNNLLAASGETTLYFEDKLLGITLPVASDHFAYEFTEAGDQLDRFEVRASQVSTDLQELTSNGLSVYILDQKLNVLSKDGSLLQEVEVLDVTGRLLYKATGIDSEYWQEEANFSSSSVLIVKALTKKGRYLHKLINK